MTHENEQVRRARAGDRAALDALVAESKDLVYNLAVRMLGNRADAEDTSQEILIRIVTGLATWRGESSFRTWVYRVASNHLLTAKKLRAERAPVSFEAMEDFLDRGIAADLPPLEDQLLVTEARLKCTTSMLTCLDRDHRLAFVLGEILELTSEEGAEALEISPDAFRKRLSRARDRMSQFVTPRCGLINPRLPCRCAKQAACAVAGGGLSLESAQWATHPTRVEKVAAPLEGLGELERMVAVFRNHPDYLGPASLVSGLKALLTEG